jgi:hypothetical protein
MKLLLLAAIAFVAGILAGIMFEREFPSYPLAPRRLPW